jgi:hypothetical protein
MLNAGFHAGLAFGVDWGAKNQFLKDWEKQLDRASGKPGPGCGARNLI